MSFLAWMSEGHVVDEGILHRVLEYVAFDHLILNLTVSGSEEMEKIKIDQSGR